MLFNTPGQVLTAGNKWHALCFTHGAFCIGIWQSRCSAACMGSMGDCSSVQRAFLTNWPGACEAVSNDLHFSDNSLTIWPTHFGRLAPRAPLIWAHQLASRSIASGYIYIIGLEWLGHVIRLHTILDSHGAERAVPYYHAYMRPPCPRTHRRRVS